MILEQIARQWLQNHTPLDSHLSQKSYVLNYRSTISYHGINRALRRRQQQGRGGFHPLGRELGSRHPRGGPTRDFVPSLQLARIFQICEFARNSAFAHLRIVKKNKNRKFANAQLAIVEIWDTLIRNRWCAALRSRIPYRPGFKNHRGLRTRH